MSARVRAACAAFGLDVEEWAQDERTARLSRAVEAAERLDAALVPGGVALVTGPSGSGKSSILRALEGRLRVPAVRSGVPRGGSRAAVDMVGRTFRDASRLLAMAGLAEATVMVRPVSELSDGQRGRLEVACAFDRAERAGVGHGVTVLLDEFGSRLDRVTGEALARTVRRWVAGSGACRVVCASADDGLIEALGPDVLAVVGADGSASVHVPTAGATCGCATADRWRRMPRGGVNPGTRVRIGRGDMSDYHALSRHHYRAGRPATVVRVLRAVEPRSRERVGVLVVSRPTLDGWWRQLAWPGRYRTGDRRADTRRLNAEVRAISRVIVDPRWRGVGIGKRLVRAYLADPLSPMTEAAAAMGACCPFFHAAGMVEYVSPPAPREARLGDALAAAGVDAWALRGDPGGWPALVRHEAARWALSSRVTRALMERGWEAVGRGAWAALCAPRVAYAWSGQRGWHV
jgi:ABC-type lipoprotein export system ATPase subunit/GNAT superfamily N-acetyltransferase